MRLFLSFITIIAAIAVHPHLHAQEVTKEAPPSPSAQIVPGAVPPAPSQQIDLGSIPRATVMSVGKPKPPVDITQFDLLTVHELTVHDHVYYITGHPFLITTKDHTLQADSGTYDDDTGEVTLQGHVRVAGGDNDEYIEASHGTYNLATATGQFYDVHGSVGLNGSTKATAGTFSNDNPVLFTGRMVIKTGARHYDVYQGTLTSCLLPNPDWQFFSNHITMNDRKASAKSSTFKLIGLPVLFLPFVTYPVNPENRQSGLLIPVLSQSSTKGFIIGENFYFALGRSADLTLGSEYFSARGYSESGTFRYRGIGGDKFDAHFSALQDRGYIDSTTGLYVNQGGQDVTAVFRRKLTENTRVVGDAEYLSSYVYREAFTENFNQAVSSDITSIGYIVHQNNGYSIDGRVDRYQGLKRVPVGTLPGQQIRLFHVPSFDFDAVDHRIPGTPFIWNMSASATGLKRSQPNFISSGIVERFDVNPELSLPLSGGGWHTMSSIGIHETFYSRSRQSQGAVPIEQLGSINRAALDMKVDIRPPAIERTFMVPPSLQKIFGTQLRHTVEAEFNYRNVRGVDRFLNILRFDDTDLLSNTNELEYGVTQHIYFRPKPSTKPTKPGCPANALGKTDAFTSPDPDADLPDEPQIDALQPTADSSTDANGIPSADGQAAGPPTRHAKRRDPCAPEPGQLLPQQEWFSWKLAQRHFFDPTFGGAVVSTRRNILDSTLSLSGIAFLTEPRSISPLISRMRFRTGTHTDVEWDFDLDTGASKFTSSNIFVDVHEKSVFGGLSYARLNAPGRFSTEDIDTNTLTSSPTSNFSQMRVLLGYGTPQKQGLSVAGNAGLDLKLGGVQYLSTQANYNWNCCGLSVEYRKYELGSVRNEGVERFSFTLVNIGSAGNLRRAERIF